MKKLAALAVLVVVGVVGPARAATRSHCTPRAEPTSASGTLVRAALTPRGHGRYRGTLKVHVTRFNHQAVSTDQTYTLQNAHVSFHRGVTPAALARGSRIAVSGTITVLPSRRCLTINFTPTITVRKVDVRPAR